MSDTTKTVHHLATVGAGGPSAACGRVYATLATQPNKVTCPHCAPFVAKLAIQTDKDNAAKHAALAEEHKRLLAEVERVLREMNRVSPDRSMRAWARNQSLGNIVQMMDHGSKAIMVRTNNKEFGTNLPGVVVKVTAARAIVKTERGEMTFDLKPGRHSFDKPGRSYGNASHGYHIDVDDLE